MIEAFGLSIPESLQEICQPSRCAVIIYDMQVGILHQIAGGEAVVARVQGVLTAARAAGVRIVFVRHVTLPARLMGVAQLRM